MDYILTSKHVDMLSNALTFITSLIMRRISIALIEVLIVFVEVMPFGSARRHEKMSHV